MRDRLTHALIFLGALALVADAGAQLVPKGRRVLAPQFQSQMQPEDVPLKSPRLFWKSGEFLDGELTGADDTTLSFQSPLFEEPLPLLSAQLASVEFPIRATTADAGPFSVLLKNGDRLFAALDSVTPEAVRLKGDRHGDLQIAWSNIQSLRRSSGGNILYQGPHGASGWKRFGMNDGQGFPWVGGEQGAMISRLWNRSALMELSVPERVELDLVLRSSGPLRFAFCFGPASNSTQNMCIETWGDELVIAQKDRFQPLLKLTDEHRCLGLRVQWDLSAKKVRIYDWAGNPLAQFEAEDGPPPKAKISLVVRNKGLDLALEDFCVRSWDGADIIKRSVGVASVEALDGRRVEGMVQATASQDGLQVGDTTLPLDQLASYDAGCADPNKLDSLKLPLAQLLITQSAASDKSRIRYHDGSSLTGDLVGIQDGVILMRTAVLDEPIKAKLEGVVRLTLNEAGPAAAPETLETLDELRVGDIVLHGQLKGTGDSALHWSQPGSIRAVALKRSPALEIHRSENNKGTPPTSQALFFLKSGNVFGGTLREVSEDKVKFKTVMGEATEIEPAQLSAVHFRTQRQESAGFSGSGWQKLKGGENDVQRTEAEKLLVKGSGAFGHPSILAGDEIGFTMGVPSSFGALAVELFSGDLGSATKGIQLHLIYSGSEFWAVLEAGDSNNRSSEQMRNLNGRAIKVRLHFLEDSLQVLVNDLQLMLAPLDSSLRKGNGIAFSPSMMWGSPARDVEISHFYVKARPDFFTVPHVSDDARRNALTIPRFRKDTPPLHVLLAPNGDLLRGRIRSATENVIAFQAGLEEINVPIDRVTAAIWLEEPQKKESTLPAANVDDLAASVATHWLVLRDGSRLGVSVDRIDSDYIIAWTPALGNLRIPLDQVALLKLSPLPPSSAMVAYQSWKPEFAPEPVLPESGGQSSPLLNKPAPEFSLPLLGGGQFSLAAEKGKVVVLDFWATWCGPCVSSLPEQLKAFARFDPAKVRFIAVNQGEPEAQVTRFLQARGWNMTVAMDGQQEVGQKYGVESIPHCVIIGPDGAVAWTNTGYTPGDSEKVAAAVKKLLGGG